MARKGKSSRLQVLINSRSVGTLISASSGAIEFEYAASWLNWQNNFPVSLSLPLREDRYVGAPVVAVFDNLLPDNDDIRRHVAERVGAEGTDAYSLLAAVGRDCVGALQFLPEEADPGNPGEVKGTSISAVEIASILKNLGTAPLGVSEDDDFRISLAGAHEKTALLRWNGRWHRPLGTTPTTHILKPAIGKLPNGIDLSQSVENEYLCLKLTDALGLKTTKAEIEEFEGQRVLVVERFDRRWTSDNRLLRLPQEDLCQALSVPPSQKYENQKGPGISKILGLLRGSDDPSNDQAAFLRAVIVFWLLGATDGHAKNFSIFLSPGGRFNLAPLYDVLSAQPMLDAGQIQHNKMKLAMAAGDKRHYVVDTVMPRHFVQTGERAGFGRNMILPIFEDLRSRAPQALDTVEAALPACIPMNLWASVRQGVMQRMRRLDQET